LAWKLGLVLDGMAPESILEAYEVERKVKKKKSENKLLPSPWSRVND
jgi:hypothetical protein